MADESKPAASASLTVVRNPQYRLLYSQGHRLRLFPQEATITFVNITDRPNPDGSPGMQVVMDEQVSIMMSYVQVKLLAMELQALCDEFEKIRGKVQLDETGTANTRNIVQIVRNVHGKAKAAT